MDAFTSSSDSLIVKSKSIDDDFTISLHYNDIPIDFTPCKIDGCLVCICLRGSAEIEVDLKSFSFEESDIMVLFPGQVLARSSRSSDLSVAYFSFSNHLIDDILYRFPVAFIEFLRESVRYHLHEKERDDILLESFFMLHKKLNEMDNLCRGEIVLNLLHNFYMNLYSNVVNSNEITFGQRKRKKELQEEFFRLLKANPSVREVSFYASKLCITPKYLSILTKESTGCSAKELIDKYAVMELKMRLKSSSAQLKEISVQLNYPSEAFLCKFFKKHTGLTPSFYRNSVGRQQD